MKTRHAWVDYSKGICIVGVVTLYAVTKMESELGLRGWLQAWVDFARPFRMPDFFLLAGLFLARVIDRPWREYLDKKVVHYLYFFYLWAAIYLGSKLLVGRAEDGIAREVVTALYQPFAMLWFIQLLPVFFVLTRLTRRVPAAVMLPAAVLLHVFPLHTDAWLLVGHFCERFVYFYVGYRFAGLFFALAERADAHRRVALAALLVWALANQALVSAGIANDRGIAILTGLAGCAAVIVAGVLLARLPWMDWLRYLGEHSIVTYLAFFLPMGALIVAVQRGLVLQLDPGSTAALLSVFSIVFALAAFWLVRGTRWAFLFERPRWARLPAPALAGSDRSRMPAATRPAASKR